VNHSFEVGEFYKNRDGTYEVVAIDDQSVKMVIRYVESGEEKEVHVSLQERIWRNMGWDEQETSRRRATEDLRQQRGYGKEFFGLEASDFKTNVEGTRWRSRDNLAGRVARLLSDASSAPPYTFIAGAVYRWPVAFLTHVEWYEMANRKQGVLRAKFTIELDDQSAYYGLYIERGTPDWGNDWDWLRLQRALKSDPPLVELMERLEKDHHLRFLGRIGEGEKGYHFANGLDMGARPLWDESYPSSLSVRERLLLTEALTADQWLECYLVATTPKKDAVEQGVQIAQTMAGTMKAMLPLYTAAVKPVV
jgi:hypothetical protein